MIRFVHAYTKSGRGHSIIAMEGEVVKATGPVAGYKSPATLTMDGIEYVCFNEVFQGKAPVDVVLMVTRMETSVQGSPASAVKD